MDSLKEQGLWAFFWDIFGKFARHSTSFIVTIFLARLLEPSEFGLIAMVMVIVSIAFIFTDVGLGSALIQRRRVLPVHYASVFYFNLFVGVVLTLITFFSATWISDFYDNPQLTPITHLMSLLFLINAFSSLQINKLRKELNYAALAKADVSAAVLSGVTGIALAFYGAGVWSLVAQALSRGVFRHGNGAGAPAAGVQCNRDRRGQSIRQGRSRNGRDRAGEPARRRREHCGRGTGREDHRQGRYNYGSYAKR